MRPSIRQLQYLVAIADTGRFTEAAKRMHVSQPSLSNQLAEMEVELACALVERGRNGAFLTPIGEEVAKRARFILSEVEDIRAVTRETANGLAGRIRLGVLPSVGPYLLPTATKRLHEKFPELRLSVHEERTVDLETHLTSGHFDIIMSTSDAHITHKSIDLFNEDLWICTASDDPLTHETGKLPLSSLAGRSILGLGPGHRFSQLVEELARKAGAYISEEYQGTSLDAIRQMALMGAGIAILPSLYVKVEAQRDKDITLRQIDDPLAQRSISLIWRAKSPLAKKFEILADNFKVTACDLL